MARITLFNPQSLAKAIEVDLQWRVSTSHRYDSDCVACAQLWLNDPVAPNPAFNPGYNKTASWTKADWDNLQKLRDADKIRVTPLLPATVMKWFVANYPELTVRCALSSVGHWNVEAVNMKIFTGVPTLASQVPNPDQEINDLLKRIEA